MKSRGKLLVVDDELVIQGAVRKVCAEEGLEVDGADTVEAGLRLLNARTYLAALVDLMLPAVGGMRVLETARRRFPAMPVVIITGYATPGRTVECLVDGAFDVLPKPFDAAELTAVLRRALAFATHPGIPGAVPSGGAYALGGHSWARIGEEGTAVLGLGPGFGPLIGHIGELETAENDAELVQGKRMATITCEDGLAHRVWAPLGGRVVRVHGRVQDDGGVLRIVPADPELELARLTLVK